MKFDGQAKGLRAELRLIFSRTVQVWRLVPLRHKAALVGAAVLMAFTSACNTAVPLLLGRLVDRIKGGLEQGLSHAALFEIAGGCLAAIGTAYVLREGLNVLRRYLVENTCTRINRDAVVGLVSHVLKGDLAPLQREQLGALHGRMFRSVDGFVRFLRLSFLDFFPAIFTGVFALVAVVSMQPLLGLVMAGVIPIAVWITVRQLISQKGVRLELMRSCEEIDAAVVEHLGGVEYVRAADTHAQEVLRVARACERRRAKEIRHHFQMSLYGCAKALNEGFFHILVLGLAIYLAVTRPEAVSLGDVLTFSILFLSVLAPLGEVHRVIDEGHESSLRVGDLLEMLAEPVDRSFTVVQPQEPRLLPGVPAVTFEDVTAEYKTADGERRRGLDGVTLSIRHGETIGVAGRSGGGKTTWLKVLLRLAHPCGGRVRLGGVDLERIPREAIARLVGYVGQNPFVFAGTVAQNIAYGKEGVGREDIRRAAEMAHLHDEIMQMPGSYDAVVAERGQNLSGGQRQRLAIARILLRQPPILILDEATSALDNISERYVQKALGLTGVDRTTILVAHRLTTLQDADRIVVFEDGRIVEVGTYHQLLRRGGVFTELVASAGNSPAEAGRLEEVAHR